MSREKDIVRLYEKDAFNEPNFKKWFTVIYVDSFEQLYRYAYSITKNKPLAEDVVSEVFMSVWKTKPTSNTKEELKSYLYTSVKRLAVRSLLKNRSESLDQDSELVTLQLIDSVNPENLLLGKELDSVIQGIVQDFSSYTSLVYELFMKKGLSYDEISAELGISKRTVEKHMSNALKKLRSSLQKHIEKDQVVYSFLKKASAFSIALTLAQLIFIIQHTK